MPDTSSTESVLGGQTAEPPTNTTPAARLLLPSGGLGEVPLAKGELMRDEDLLSSSFRRDVETVVSPLAVLAAITVLVVSVRRTFRLEQQRQRERAPASVKGAIDAR